MQLTNEEAEQLVARYGDLLLRVAWSWMGNPADAQDICQTVLLRRLTVEKTFDTPEAERAWLIRVAVNECKNLHKSAFRRRRADLEEAQTVAVHLPEESEVLDAVRRLPPKYATAIFLRYYEGYGVGEIAQMMGVKPALASTWLARGREKLKTLLGGELYGTLSKGDG